MNECCILFPHHRNDELTARHYQQLVAYNPYPVVPICCNEEEYLPGAIDVGKWTPPPKHKNNNRHLEQLIFRFFSKGLVDAQRYIVLEYDVCATVGVRKFYDPVWNADAAATSVYHYGYQEWPWFREVDRLPTYLHCHAAGIAPFNGAMFSRRALEEVTKDDSVPDDVYCELRMGTLLKKNGLRIETMPWWEKTNRWGNEWIPFDPSKPWIFHPVKK